MGYVKFSPFMLTSLSQESREMWKVSRCFILLAVSCYSSLQRENVLLDVKVVLYKLVIIV